MYDDSRAADRAALNYPCPALPCMLGGGDKDLTKQFGKLG
jgi:hypothetical protein